MNLVLIATAGILAVGMDTEYERIALLILLAGWVLTASSYCRDARRYQFVRDNLSVAVDAETGEAIKPPPSAMDRSVDRQMAEARK